MYRRAIELAYVNMLIALGGLLGSGRRLLSDALALKYGIYQYDLTRKKVPMSRFDAYGNSRVRQPSTDAERIKIYDKILLEFPRLSKMHQDIIVGGDAFHREIPREFFFNKAAAYYRPIVFVWIETTEEQAKKNIEHLYSLGMVGSISGALQWRARAIEQFQEPHDSVPRFNYSSADDEQVTKLWELIQKCSD